MNKHTKLFSVLSYITWVGFLIAMFCRDKDDRMVEHHLNQSLVLHLLDSLVIVLTRVLGDIIPFLGPVLSICGLVIFILEIIGIVRAFQLRDDPLPLIGGIHLLG